MVSPRVTVLMPVYNAERFLKEAIESILQQSYRDFELLIVYDDSKDDSLTVIQSFSDPRIRLVRNPARCKLAGCLNLGLELAGGEYVARMDADDVSLPERLARQVSFLDAHPDIGIVGTWFQSFGASTELHKPYCDSDRLACALLFNSPLAHPAVMMRASVMKAHGLLYDPSRQTAEDWDLWIRASRFCKLANLPAILLHYRRHEGSLTAVHLQANRDGWREIAVRNLKVLNIVPSESELAVHESLAFQRGENTREFASSARDWLVKLWRANQETSYYPRQPFAQILAGHWYTVCRQAYASVPARLVHFGLTPFSWRGVFAKLSHS
jgi:glycosyltransferase involved in cell wall biosynthesis